VAQRIEPSSALPVLLGMWSTRADAVGGGLVAQAHQLPVLVGAVGRAEQPQAGSGASLAQCRAV